MREGNVFILSSCLSVCLSLCACLSLCLCVSVWAVTFECFDFLFDHIKVMFEYQGRWLKVKVTLVNGLFELLDTRFFPMTNLWYQSGRKGQGHLNVYADVT